MRPTTWTACRPTCSVPTSWRRTTGTRRGTLASDLVHRARALEHAVGLLAVPPVPDAGLLKRGERPVGHLGQQFRGHVVGVGDVVRRQHRLALDPLGAV